MPGNLIRWGCWGRSLRGVLQERRWDLRRGMFGCAVWQRWHRSSIFKNLSSTSGLHGFTLPQFSTSANISCESRKKSVVKEFQCFLFFRHGESRSWLITCMCNCCIEGTWSSTRCFQSHYDNWLQWITKSHREVKPTCNLLITWPRFTKKVQWKISSCWKNLVHDDRRKGFTQW